MHDTVGRGLISYNTRIWTIGSLPGRVRLLWGSSRHATASLRVEKIGNRMIEHFVALESVCHFQFNTKHSQVVQWSKKVFVKTTRILSTTHWSLKNSSFCPASHPIPTNQTPSRSHSPQGDISAPLHSKFSKVLYHPSNQITHFLSSNQG